MKQMIAYCLFATLLGCTTVEKKSVELTVGREKKMALSALPKIRASYPALRDFEIQSYISSLGEQITKANDLENKPYRFSFVVVDSPEVTAFALPAGQIFVSANLLHLVESEPELAGVIAHEIGHVVYRHTSLRLHDQELNGKKRAIAFGAGGALVGAAAGYLASEAICGPLRDQCAPSFVATGTATGVGLGLTLQKKLYLAHSRANELEADEFGLEAAIRAGFSPRHVNDFYRRLANDSPAYASTHPPGSRRYQAVESIRRERTDLSAIVSSSAFLSMREHLQTLNRRRELAAKPSQIVQSTAIADDPIRKE